MDTLGKANVVGHVVSWCQRFGTTAATVGDFCKAHQLDKTGRKAIPQLTYLKA